MTVVRIVIHAVLRTGVLVLLLATYDFLYDKAFPPTPGDADIGKGLLAFMLIVVVCLTWGLADGALLSPVVWALAWLATGLSIGIFWEALPGVGEGSLETIDPTLVTFMTQLILVPALVGAGFAWLIRSRRQTPASA